MTPIRDKAEGILDAIPNIEIRSNGATAGQYTTYTGGLTQARLEANWKAGGKMTGCNEFTGWYGSRMGSKDYLGRFDLPDYLPKIGKRHAWVKSTPARRPKYGDILLHTGLHADVCLDFDGDVLNRLAAGQGGRALGYDILCRVRGKAAYNPANLQGWIDLDLYFGPAPTSLPIPSWLPGWWKVGWRSQVYYYWFDNTRHVKWTQLAPPDTAAPMAHASDTGSVTVESANAFAIIWGASGSIEKFHLLPYEPPQMSGTWNETDRLDAVRL
jgi:hypothetical protein